MKNEYDSIDALLTPIFILAVAGLVGLGEATVGGVSTAGTAFSLGEVGIPGGALVAAVVLGTVYITNDRDVGNLDPLHYYAVSSTAGVLLLLATVNPLLEWVQTQSDIVGVGITILASAGFAAVSYYG